MIELYAEYGIIGVVVILFSYMIMNLMKSQKEQTEDLEKIKQSIRKMESVNDNSASIIIKLIDRWNKSDEKAERRHEKFVDEMNQITDDLNFLKGRINGVKRNS